MAKVLLIEDEALVRATVKRILERAGHQVIEASDGSDGINKFHREPCQLVFTDLLMPAKDGVSVIKELTREYPMLPIIATSGGGRNGNLDFLKLAELYGAFAILPKPYKPLDLLNLINKAMAY